jgi:hypothetical protein
MTSDINEDWLRRIGFGEPTINGWPLLTEAKYGDPIELWYGHDGLVTLVQSNTNDQVLLTYREYRNRQEFLSLLYAIGVLVPG